MMTYNIFLKKLFMNYIIGSFVSVLGVSGILIVTTINVTKEDMKTLLFVLLISVIIMFLSEYLLFKKHISPIKRCFQKGEHVTFTELENAFKQTHRFPMLCGIRILGPHLWGLSIPAIILTIILISYDIILLSYEYIIYAMIGAILIASMHAMIEYFQTTFIIEPVLDELQQLSLHLYEHELSLEENILVSLKTKFQLSALLIGAFPLLLFSLVTYLRITQLDVVTLEDYWIWAGFILLMAMALSLYGAWLLFTIIKKPINVLIKKMKKIESGDFHRTKMKNYYSDEFSILVNGFNHMVASIKENDQLKNQILENFIATLAAALDARDPYTAGHSIRVANYAVAIGKKANFNERKLRILKQSALLHDIGKIGIPDVILLKQDRLTDEEYEIIKTHPVLGVEMIKNIQPTEITEALLPGIHSHHERFDGKGYPDGLSGYEIPELGRIIAVADAFDAMTSDRTYRKGLSKEKALKILKDGRNIQWDPYYVNLFIEWFYENQLDEQNSQLTNSILTKHKKSV